MVSRRFGRPVWVPARILWLPVLLVGLWFLLGADLSVADLGRGEHRVQFLLPSVTHWVDAPFRFGVGMVLTVSGLVLFGLFQWRPDPDKWRFTAQQYGAYSLAAFLAASAALAAWLYVDFGETTARSAGGLDLRLVVMTRDNVGSLLLTALCALFAVVLLGFSLGPAKRSPPEASAVERPGAAVPVVQRGKRMEAVPEAWTMERVGVIPVGQPRKRVPSRATTKAPPRKA